LRSKLGLELCLEALKEVHRSGITPAEILHYARMNRVENVMMPYVQAMSIQLDSSPNRKIGFRHRQT